MQALTLPGLSDYVTTHALQERLVGQRIRDEIEDTVILVEHAEVLTLGRKPGSERSVLDAEDVPVVRVERGGDATWHGPGQLVAYPIVKLEGDRRDLHRHLRALEEAVIGLLAELGLEGRRDARNTGVWLEDPDAVVRKVCSVGIACRSWVTWHGLALNLDPDPRAWTRLRPCGFDGDVMTSVARHLRPAPTPAALAEPLFRHLAAALTHG